MQSITARKFKISLNAFGNVMPFISEKVGNFKRNESSFSKNSIQVMMIRLAVPDAIPKTSARTTIVSFRLSLTRVRINCSQVDSLVRLYFC